jgi:hypothetical protein
MTDLTNAVMKWAQDFHDSAFEIIKLGAKVKGDEDARRRVMRLIARLGGLSLALGQAVIFALENDILLTQVEQAVENTRSAFHEINRAEQERMKAAEG